MPRQNRVDPFGQIVATPERGTLMGNRGCLHDRGDHPVRQFAVRRWLICVLDFKGRTRSPMPPGHYTSLFFLDEATALAAGHRPCAECQRARFEEFRSHWAAANPKLAGRPKPNVDTIDGVLHAERLSDHSRQRDKRKRSYPARLAELPDGVMVVLEGHAAPLLVQGERLLPWSFAGYGAPIVRTTAHVQVLTPPSIVRALAHGYAPDVDMSAASDMIER
ncbi:MAG TPA: hypothetical protein VFX76_04170 [Roseiflexaceae bacterium]|nr:hypothetical protein [Roseiflexaceae bacterium]